jgi:succinate dehydrogenase hydrophobic anchor subunit
MVFYSVSFLLSSLIQWITTVNFATFGVTSLICVFFVCFFVCLYILVVADNESYAVFVRWSHYGTMDISFLVAFC